MEKEELEIRKLAEEIKELKRPWHKRLDAWVAIFAILSSIAAFSFQYSLHDQTLLVAKAEKSLAFEEKTKAENDKFFALRQQIALSDKTAKFLKDIRELVEKHNKLISSITPVSEEAKALMAANDKFLEELALEEKTIVVPAAVPNERIEYYSIVDQVIKSIIQIAALVVLFMLASYWVKRNHPEILEFLKRQIANSNAKKGN